MLQLDGDLLSLVDLNSGPNKTNPATGGQGGIRPPNTSLKHLRLDVSNNKSQKLRKLQRTLCYIFCEFKNKPSC